MISRVFWQRRIGICSTDRRSLFRRFTAVAPEFSECIARGAAGVMPHHCADLVRSITATHVGRVCPLSGRPHQLSLLNHRRRVDRVGSTANAVSNSPPPSGASAGFPPSAAECGASTIRKAETSPQARRSSSAHSRSTRHNMQPGFAVWMFTNAVRRSSSACISGRSISLPSPACPRS